MRSSRARVRGIITVVSGRVVRTQAERLSGYRRVLEARSPDVTVERLRLLAVDEIRPVRLWTARSLLTPPDALDLLARDEDSSVQWNALINPHLPESALRWLADLEAERAGSRWFLLRQRIVHHPNACESLRSELVAAGACSCPGLCGRHVYARQAPASLPH